VLHGIGPLDIAKGFFYAPCEKRRESVSREDVRQSAARSEVFERDVAFDGDAWNVEAVQIAAGAKMATVITEGPVKAVLA